MDKNAVIATLNDLIETSGDGAEGFRTCAHGVKSVQFKQMFEDGLKKDLPADVRSMAERQYEGVKQHRARAHQLRNTVS